MEETPVTNQQATQPKFPALLMTLCILSIVAVAFTTVYDLILMSVNSISKAEFQSMMKQTGQDLDKATFDLIMTMVENSWQHLLLNLLELAGVILLLTRRTIGFHLYAASQIGLCWIAFLWVPTVAYQNLFVSILFVAAYFFAIKKLNAQAVNGDNSATV